MSKDEILAELYAQTSPEFIEKIGEIVTKRVLEQIPNYYQGGAEGLFKRYCNHFGGYANIYFRLGRAGFNHGFFLSYHHYDSDLELLKLKDTELSLDYLLTNKDIDQIVNNFVTHVNYYLGEEPKTKTEVANCFFIKKPSLIIQLVELSRIIASESLEIV